ncbi:acyl-CoA thioesterase [Gemmatirosa kalamazoonensis]|nr:thioesterase family protein [Gemmatirosa kalamazoonensis]
MTSSTTAPASAVPAHAFEFAERVRWEDVDLVAIVRYSAYTRLLDVVEAELFRAAGLAHPAMLDRHGIWLVRRVLHLEYHAPAHFDDLLRLRAWIGRVGRTSLTLHVAVFDDAGERLHAAGHLVLVAVEAAGMTAVEVPAEVTRALAPFQG